MGRKADVRTPGADFIVARLDSLSDPSSRSSVFSPTIPTDLVIALDDILASIPWHLPAKLIVRGQARFGETFLEAVRAFAGLSLDDRSHSELVFDNERLPGSLKSAAIEGYIKHLPSR